MKKSFSIFVLATTLLSFPVISPAQTEKTITLKDGSMLQGHVLKLENGLYAIETATIGEVQIPEENILSISTPGMAPVQPPVTDDSDQRKALMKQQVEQVQGSLMSDPQLLGDLQNMAEDPEVQRLLSDPQLLKDIMSYDQEKIQNNQNVQALQDNPKIREMIEKINAKMTQPQE